MYKRNVQFYLIISSLLLFIGILFGSIERELANIYLEIFNHSLFIISGLLLLIGFIYSLIGMKNDSTHLLLLTIALVFVVSQPILVIFFNNDLGREFYDEIQFGMSAISLGLIIAATVYGYLTKNFPAIKLKYHSSFSKQASVGVFLGLLVLISGILLTASGTRSACVGWPLCQGSIFPSDSASWMVLSHRLVGAIVGIYLIWLNFQAWRKQKSQQLILPLSNLFVVLYFAQGFVGAIKTIQMFPPYMVILHTITAVTLTVVGAVLLVSIGLIGRTEDDEIQEANLPVDRKQRLKDLLALNKPVIVLLLLSTAIAGMIIGAGKLPSSKILVVTIIGGFLAAGGSSAINQYIDKDLDKLMTRTSKRPLPSGRLTPAEGLAFGITAIVISFYLLAAFVNILAAMLALAGMLYYVVLYSVFLKKKSVQNIVIGGGAGAIPPLVGWAASTGSLTIGSLFLFIIIFLWTPPHFWALALLRKNEYASAGVPMMPVIKGEQLTQKLIFQYTIVLVATTILMWLFGQAGWFYLFGALLLGAYLIYLAGQVMRKGRNRTYYKMYRHSSYYLFFLFVILAIDSIMH